MGWETAAFAGFSLLGASNKMDQGKAQAQALADQGTYQEKNIADQTVRNVGKLQTSFLQSGIALDDLGGTKSVISQAVNQGTTDIARTANNADNAAKNAYNSARTAALETLAGGAMKMGAGSFGSISDTGNFLNDQAAYSLNDMGYGNTAYDMLDNSDSLDPSPNGWRL